MTLSIETVECFLDRYGDHGWAYNRLDETTIASGFRGEVTTFQFFIKIAADWVYFVLVPFVGKPRVKCRERLFEHLLRLNYEMNLVKAGLDEDGDVSLTVEVPSDALDIRRFSDALDGLSYYADTHYLDTLNVAMNPAYRATAEEQE